MGSYLINFILSFNLLIMGNIKEIPQGEPSGFRDLDRSKDQIANFYSKDAPLFIAEFNNHGDISHHGHFNAMYSHGGKFFGGDEQGACYVYPLHHDGKDLTVRLKGRGNLAYINEEQVIPLECCKFEKYPQGTPAREILTTEQARVQRILESSMPGCNTFGGKIRKVSVRVLETYEKVTKWEDEWPVETEASVREVLKSRKVLGRVKNRK